MAELTGGETAVQKLYIYIYIYFFFSQKHLSRRSGDLHRCSVLGTEQYRANVLRGAALCVVGRWSYRSPTDQLATGPDAGSVRGVVVCCLDCGIHIIVPACFYGYAASRGQAPAPHGL